ncbi:hypothetical protein BpHYR1_052555 [Brachionus plicatilis]|uniref:Uncharacterized protein n=1 Tax=Brachionus plicatilis TaxID=10195 RepID=A0A3M7PRC0_BRAPC|nr:hypothetical protein BpHYR1_052555 [Brachionus plicatilis]
MLAANFTRFFFLRYLLNFVSFGQLLNFGCSFRFISPLCLGPPFTSPLRSDSPLKTPLNPEAPCIYPFPLPSPEFFSVQPSSPIIVTVYISDPPELTVNISVMFEVTVYFSVTVSATAFFSVSGTFFAKIFRTRFRLRESGNFSPEAPLFLRRSTLIYLAIPNLLFSEFCRFIAESVYWWYKGCISCYDLQNIINF